MTGARCGAGVLAGVLAWAVASPVLQPSVVAGRPAERPIVITRADSLAGRSFEIVGRVVEKTRDRGMIETEEQLVDGSSAGLVRQARALGADAVLGVHGLRGSSDSQPRWVSGVAVRWLEPGAGVASRRAGFVVVVLPIEIPDTLVQKAKARARLADALHDQARSMLETRGYYTAANAPAIADTATLAAMSDSVWNASFGQWTENVLAIEFGRSHSSNLVIQSRRETAVEAWLYSRAAGRVTWRREAVGSANNWKAFDPQFQWRIGAGYAGSQEVLEKSLASAVARVLEEAPSPSP